MSGSVRDQSFAVEITGMTETAIRTLDLRGEVQKKLERLQTLPDSAAARFFSAQRYLLQARRLQYTSDYPSQFLGERLLNLYKVLEVLFGRDVRQFRSDLEQLQLRRDVAELLVGLVYIRDESDVGHPAIHGLNQASYETIQKYVLWLEEVITWLLDHVLDRVAAGRFQLQPVSKRSSKRIETLTAVAQNVAKVNPLQPETFLVESNGD